MLIIQRVTPGTWADVKGIEPGDIFEAINGRHVSELTGEEFKTLMKERPLSMRISALHGNESEENEDRNATPARRRMTVFDTESESTRALKYRFSVLDNLEATDMATAVTARSDVDVGTPSSCRVALIVEGSREDCVAALALALGMKSKGYSTKVELRRILPQPC